MVAKGNLAKRKHYFTDYDGVLDDKSVTKDKLSDEILVGIATAHNNLATHQDNIDVHIQTGERELWNTASDKVNVHYYTSNALYVDGSSFKEQANDWATYKSPKTQAKGDLLVAKFVTMGQGSDYGYVPIIEKTHLYFCESTYSTTGKDWSGTEINLYEGTYRKICDFSDIGDLSRLTTTNKNTIVEAINEKKIFYLNATEATLNNISDDGIYTLTLEADVHQQTTGEILIYTNKDNTDAQIFLCVLVERFRSNTVGTYLSIPSETVIKNALLNPIKSTITGLSNKIDTHTTDTDIHITADERALWNTVSDKAEQSEVENIQSQMGDVFDLPTKSNIVDEINTQHEEINELRNEMSGLDVNITVHSSDEEMHITYDERDLWNNNVEQTNANKGNIEALQTQMGDVETALADIRADQEALINGGEE